MAEFRRPVRLPSAVVEGIASYRPAPDTSGEDELSERLHAELAAMPDDQRAAVVAALGYDEGPVGAAMEAGCDVDRGAELTEAGLERLRRALGGTAPGSHRA